jgi:ubiquinone/menaquinone biosynthesis C-methylase UbiE
MFLNKLMNPQEAIWDDMYSKKLTWKKETISLKNILTGKKVLELGAGNGKTLNAILRQKPKEITAIDISSQAIKRLKGINANVTKADFLKFKTNDKFEVIVCYYFLNNFNQNERKKVVKKIKGLLSPRGVILFEDFAIGDYRQKGLEIERNTIQKSNGLICHFFDKTEIEDLFRHFKIEIVEKTLFPIRKDKSIERKIINCVIKNAPGRI